MTEKQIVKNYILACAGCNQTPNEDRIEPWKDQLGRFEESEVRAAITRWQGDITEVEHFGDMRPRGATMPAPVDIVSLVLRARSQKATGNKYVPCGLDGCTDGLKLVERETAIYGAPRKVRAVTKCECKLQWEQSRGTVSVAATAATNAPSFSTLLTGGRRIQ